MDISITANEAGGFRANATTNGIQNPLNSSNQNNQNSGNQNSGRQNNQNSGNRNSGNAQQNPSSDAEALNQQLTKAGSLTVPGGTNVGIAPEVRRISRADFPQTLQSVFFLSASVRCSAVRVVASVLPMLIPAAAFDATRSNSSRFPSIHLGGS
jgi:hypothetical protein